MQTTEPSPRPLPGRHLLIALVVAACATAGASAEDAGAVPLRLRVLNLLDGASAPGLGSWMVDHLSASPAVGVHPRLGAGASVITGDAKAGGKVDLSLFDGELAGCRRLSVWVAAEADGNVERVGFQVRDAKGEWLMQTVPLAAAGWQHVDLDPTAGAMRQAYEQKDQDGVVDLPLTSVHVVWFAKTDGRTALTLNALTASVAVAPADDAVTVLPSGAEVIEAGAPLAMRFLAENHGDHERTVEIRYSLQINPQFSDPPLPDPVLGYDHARGAPCSLTVDGVDRGDPLLTDGDDSTAFETPWGNGGGELVATIDLGRSREISAVHWQPGDANWVFKADLSTSLDGVTFTPVPGAQGVDLHGQWGGPHAFPWPRPIAARQVRVRFHDDGRKPECTRLPSTLMVYDGIANDAVTVPQVGRRIDAGSARVVVPPRDVAEVVLTGTSAIGAGGYLLGLERTVGSRQEVTWSPLFARPLDTVAPDRARRFGINGNASDAVTSASMRRCGFGWVRFENAKWMMFMPSRDHVGFDGSVAPWNLDFDRIFADYHKLGLQVLPYVFQPPGWASTAAEGTHNREGFPPKDAADYGEAVFQLVARYGRAQVRADALKSTDKRSGLGLIDAVELWNEPNLNDPGWGPFVGPLSQYFEVLRAGAEGAHRADPSLTVTSAGFAGIDLATVGQLAEHRYADGKTPLDFVDVVNVHFYSGRQEPEICGWDPNVSRNGPATGGTTYPEQLEDLVDWRDRLKPKAEIWLTETGNDVGGPIGRSEWHQAGKLPRDVMIALASGIDRVMIYRETGSTPSQHAGAGLLRDDGSTRPSWITMATMMRQLQGLTKRALRLPSEDPDVWMYLWEEGNRRMLACWTIGTPRTLGLDAGHARMTDAFGCATEVTRTDDVRIGYFPTYLDITQPSAGFTHAIADARAKAAAHVAQRRRLSEAPMRLLDFGSLEHVGMLTGHGVPRRFTPVLKDTLWDEKAGFGFVAGAPGEEDHGWVSDPLERDAVKMDPSTIFRLRLPAGRHRLRISATARGPGVVTLVVRAGTETQTKDVSEAEPLADLIVTGGGMPVEVTFKDWALIRWLTAMPADAE